MLSQKMGYIFREYMGYLSSQKMGYIVSRIHGVDFVHIKWDMFSANTWVVFSQKCGISPQMCTWGRFFHRKWDPGWAWTNQVRNPQTKGVRRTNCNQPNVPLIGGIPSSYLRYKRVIVFCPALLCRDCMFVASFPYSLSLCVIRLAIVTLQPQDATHWLGFATRLCHTVSKEAPQDCTRRTREANTLWRHS